MRWLSLSVAALCLAGPFRGAAEARLQVATELRSNDGDKDIQYLAPELERAIAQAATKAGLDDATVTVLLDERSNGDVRLYLSTKAAKIEADGKMAKLDQLVVEGVAKLRVALDDAAGGRGKKEPKGEERPTKIAAAVTKPDPKSEPKPDPKSEPKPEPKVEPKPEPKVEPKPEPKVEPKPEPKVEPAAPDMASVLQNPYPIERRRVVAHAVADSLTTTYPTTGSLATQALYFFLARRLRLQVMPTGFGLVAPAVITDETHRAQAGTGVMAELRDITVRPIEGSPPEVKVKLEVVAVRDGKVVFRREIESAPTTGTLVRGRPVDPFYMAVLGALDSVRNDLQALF